MDARKRAYGSCGLLDFRFRGNERSCDGQTQESQRSRFARIVVEVRIGRADAVDLLLLPGSQRLARVEAPDAFQQALAAQDFVAAGDHPMEVLLAASKIAALQSVTWASSAKSSADTSFLATAAWMRSKSSTARLTHTLQWPSSPPLMRTVRSRPFAATVKGVTRSRMMGSSLPV